MNHLSNLMKNIDEQQVLTRTQPQPIYKVVSLFTHSADTVPNAGFVSVR